jgi:hypothetical protein
VDEWDEHEEYRQGDGSLWRVCWQCGGEGVSDHDCGEDCCNCLHPEDNVRCDICEGKGGWVVQPATAESREHHGE